MASGIRRRAVGGKRMTSASVGLGSASAVPVGQCGTIYRGVVSASCTAAMSLALGSSEERRQLDECILEPRWTRLGLDTALVQKLAGIALARFRELAESFAPDPRPKR